MKNKIAVFFLSLALLFTISCSYMKTDLGDETIDVSITQIKTSSGGTGVILSFNTISSDLVIPSTLLQELSVLKVSFAKTTNLSSLKSISIPSSVTEIDTFKGATSLESVELPDSIKVLPSFSGCTLLKSVIIPEGLTEIPENCFENCKALQSISKPTDNPEGGETLNGIKEIGKKAFTNCSNLKNIALETTSITELKEQTFYNCSLLSTITLPETIQFVQTEAFSGCTALTEVNRFELITSFASGNIKYTKIFNSCKKLSSITISAQVKEIPADMFNGCTSIRTFTIPENVEKIGSSAFAATSLEELYCYSKIPPEISKSSLPEMKVEEEKKTEEKKESTADEETEEDVEVEEEIKYKKVFTLYIPAESESLYKEKWDDLVDWRVIDIKTLPAE